MKKKLLFIVLILTLVISNFVNISIGESYNFESRNGEFKYTLVPTKGGDFDTMETKFNDFKKANNLNEDEKLYRSSSRNIFKFWKWYDYLTNPVWKYERS